MVNLMIKLELDKESAGTIELSQRIRCDKFGESLVFASAAGFIAKQLVGISKPTLRIPRRLRKSRPSDACFSAEAAGKQTECVCQDAASSAGADISRSNI